MKNKNPPFLEICICTKPEKLCLVFAYAKLVYEWSLIFIDYKILMLTCCVSLLSFSLSQCSFLSNRIVAAFYRTA